MAKKSGRIIDTIAIVAIISLAIAIGYFFTNTKKLEEEFQNLNSEYIALTNVSNNLSKDNEQLSLEKESYENIEESVKKQKDVFFSYAEKLEKAILDGTSDKKIAYLTFDDGPYDLTKTFLRILEEYDIQATFFELGKNYYEYGGKSVAFGKDVTEVYSMVNHAGHTIGNHTYSHKLGQGGIYSSASTFINDIKKNRELIENLVGVTTEVMRFPGGSPTAGIYKTEIINQLHDLGYGYVDWDCECGDGKYNLTASEYAQNILSTTNNQKLMVVLMHDYQENTCKALPDIIEGLKEQGYMFLPLWRGSYKVK